MADNLLDKASILLTPTAHNNGSMLSVKPTDGDGDFTFSRNSAATRVNAQGLVENVQILSGDLVQNGSFSQIGTEEVSNGNFSQEGSQLVTNGGFDTDSDWTLSGWNISGGSANNDGINTGNINQNIGLQQNKFYKISISITNYVSGALKVRLGTGNQIDVGSSNGEYILYLENTTTNSNIRFYPDVTLNFNGSIDNVSVKEVGQDWTLENGWSIGDDKAISDGSGSIPNTDLIQGNVFTTGKSYKVTLEIKDYVSGNLQLQNNTTNFPQSNGIHTIYSSEGSASLILRSLSFIGSVTNISVKEVGQNWNIENTWTIGNSVANGNGANGDAEEIIQTSVLVVGKEYKATYQVLNYASGSVALWKGSGVALIQRTANNTYTEYFTGASNQIRFRGTNFIGSITNIVIKEITNDTNLPRINYEGFSYQDSFGSELVTNGDFATNSYWQLGSGSSISGGSLNIISAPYNAATRQALSLTSGKTYKIVINAIAVGSATSNTFQLGFGTIGGNPSSNTQYEFEEGASVKTLTVTASATDAAVLFRARDASTSNLSITNVSVKEYLGQEVVPDSGCGSYILEPQSTNIYLNSETLLTQDNTTLASTYTVSFYGTGTITFSGTHTGSLVGTSLTDRVSATFTATAGTLTSTVSGTVTKGQLENLNFASSYIPTSGASSTRLRDLATDSGNATLINSTEGTLYFEGSAFVNGGVNRYVSLSDNTTSNRLQFVFTSATNRLQVSGTNVTSINYNSFVQTDNNKIAYSYSALGVRVFVNGVLVGSNTDNASLPTNTLTTLDFALWNQTSALFQGKTKALAVWKEALSDAELTALTTI